MKKIDSAEFWIIVPEETKNLVINPVPYGFTHGYEALNGATIAVDSDHSRYAARSLKVTTNGVNQGVRYSQDTEIEQATIYTFSIDIYAGLDETIEISVLDVNYAPLAPAQTYTTTDGWQRYVYTFTPTRASSEFVVQVKKVTFNSTTPFLWVDGLQLEEKPYPTTFAWGYSNFGNGYSNREYYWEGRQFLSPSIRSAHTASGGRMLRIKDYATIRRIIGLGIAPVNQATTELILGGELFQQARVGAREFGFVLAYNAENLNNVGEIWDLRKIISRHSVPNTSGIDQPLTIRFQGFDQDGKATTEPLDIIATLMTSHTDTPQISVYQEDVLMFRAHAGYLAGAYNEGGQLNQYETIPAQNIMRKKDGRWEALLTNGQGSAADVNCIMEAQNGDIYIGTMGDGLVGGIANTEGLARWNVRENTWEAVPGWSTANNRSAVFALAQDGQGRIFIGGMFDYNDGGIIRQNIRIYDPNNNTWKRAGAAVGSSTSGVLAIAISQDNEVYIGGSFPSIGGDNNKRYLAKWREEDNEFDGYGESAIVSNVTDITFHPSGTLVFAADGVYYESSAGVFWQLGSNRIRALKLRYLPNGMLLAIGNGQPQGTNMGGGAWIFNGMSWDMLGKGLKGDATGLALPDIDSPTRNKMGGRILIGGSLEALNTSPYTPHEPGIDVMDSSLGEWNEGTWSRVDVTFPDPPIQLKTTAIMQTRNGVLYIGGRFNTARTSAEGLDVFWNTGNAPAYPVIQIHGPGELREITNWTANRSIKFDGLTLLKGEWISFFLNPEYPKIVSSWEGRGNVWRYVMSGSDYGDFQLVPGLNKITLFMPNETNENTGSWIYWRPMFWNIEQALRS